MKKILYLDNIKYNVQFDLKISKILNNLSTLYDISIQTFDKSLFNIFDLYQLNMKKFDMILYNDNYKINLYGTFVTNVTNILNNDFLIDLDCDYLEYDFVSLKELRKDKLYKILN